MKEFLLVFRRASGPQSQMSPEQLQAMMKPWQDWMGGIAAQNKLVSSGARLEHQGKVIRPDGMVTDGPYVELKEAVGGYIIIRAESLEAATAMSKDCPILKAEGSVEVRALIPMD